MSDSQDVTEHDSSKCKSPEICQTTCSFDLPNLIFYTLFIWFRNTVVTKMGFDVIKSGTCVDEIINLEIGIDRFSQMKDEL